MPYDWLRINDYIKAYISAVKSAFCIKKNIHLLDLDVNYLVFREILFNLKNIYSARFWIYCPFLKKWGVDIKSLITIDHF